MESGTSLAAAWCAAAEGDTDRAIRLASDTADTACVRGQHGYEVVALQTAVQFGHAAVADRLRALASLVGGPRASIAARHAAALRDGDGAVLLEVAGQYESMGDRIAAADTAAQSGSAFSANNQRGFALLAFETARRLAAECGCGSTPALSRTQPAPFTDRQREIISLVAEGMSNSDIARSLTMSVRSVEGHLYRAAQRAGVSGRAELAAIHRGYYSVTETIGGHPVLG
jgi:DNA-binding CsgD family transcriptional regulator